MNQQDIPKLKKIAHLSVPISGTVTVNAVIDLFQQDATLLALIVETNGRFDGLTSRRDLFFQHLSKPFARDLYYRKPIRMLLDSYPLTMPADWNVHQGLEELLRRDPSLENDCFGIMEDGKCIGIVNVADLMMTISRIQADLLLTLDKLSQRIRWEVDVARRIQADLLPRTPMQHAGISVAGALVNSTEISGDYYDLFVLGDAQLGLLVADVTGHGVQAGLVTTAAKAGLQILLDNGVFSPGELLKGINRAIFATAGQQLMMTALIGVIEPQKNRLVLASAGHPYPWHYAAQNGGWTEIALDPGFPLGFDDKAQYSETTVPFFPKDRLVLFSDGIVEAENGIGQAFGLDGFHQALTEGSQLQPEQLQELLFEHARRFTGRETFEDDVTLLIAAR